MSTTKKTETAKTETAKTETAKTETAKSKLALEIAKFAKHKYDDKIAYNIDEVVDRYHAHGIGVMTTNNIQKSYRIMNGGSSLNIRRGNYIIYTNDTDYNNIVNAIDTHELPIERVDSDDKLTENNVYIKYNGNKIPMTKNVDRYRHNIIQCKSKRILEMLLAVYATNAKNLMQ